MHLAKLAAAALLVCRLRCSGWRHGVGRLRRAPWHSRRAGARLLALGSDKAGAENTTRKPHAVTSCRVFVSHCNSPRDGDVVCPIITVMPNNFTPRIKLGPATKKNPRPFTRLGFGSCCLNSHRLLTGRRGVGGWGPPCSACSAASNKLAVQIQCGCALHYCYFCSAAAQLATISVSSAGSDHNSTQTQFRRGRKLPGAGRIPTLDRGMAEP